MPYMLQMLYNMCSCAPSVSLVIAISNGMTCSKLAVFNLCILDSMLGTSSVIHSYSLCKHFIRMMNVVQQKSTPTGSDEWLKSKECTLRNLLMDYFNNVMSYFPLCSQN